MHIGETKQPLHRGVAQHRRVTASGQDSVVCAHLQAKKHRFEHQNVHILNKEDRWFERGIKGIIYVKLERPSDVVESSSPPFPVPIRTEAGF